MENCLPVRLGRVAGNAEAKPRFLLTLPYRHTTSLEKKGFPMTGTPAQSAADFLRPRVRTLIKEAEAEGYSKSRVLAVLIDLLDDTDLEDAGQ